MRRLPARLLVAAVAIGKANRGDDDGDRRGREAREIQRREVLHPCRSAMMNIVGATQPRLPAGSTPMMNGDQVPIWQGLWITHPVPNKVDVLITNDIAPLALVGRSADWTCPIALCGGVDSALITSIPPLMSSSERPSSSSSSSSSSPRNIDPLLKDLSEKKQSFRQNVVSLAVELKEVRSRLASQEHSFTLQTLSRQACEFEAEAKAKKMEEEMYRLQKNLEERNGQLQASASTAGNHLKELDDLRSQLSATRATADASAASAQSAQLQCLAMLKELDEKNSSLKEHEVRVNRLGEQLDLLQKDLQARELSQNQLKDEVLRIEHDIMQNIAQAGASKDCELRKILDEISPKNFEKINKLLTLKDEEIRKLRDEIRIMSAHWKLKTKELESQLEKHRRVDHGVEKEGFEVGVLPPGSSCSDTKAAKGNIIIPTQNMGERRDKALKELRDQLAMKQQGGDLGSEKQNFWESSSFKIVVSMSMLIVVLFSKR
ncbi:hypothetical protein HYC85_017016 [Camellia sinensis]|uniref:Uncharacterized protein n=1 Tax=Camellia sinensis TaxID=4442 RepID=A0A7J7H4Y4_CAMSI|nr:hypothetical protein HYC85_017016 [Camellia sinensis]